VFPIGNNSGNKSNEKSSAVEEHVGGVGNETKTVGNPSIDKLDAHKHQIQAQVHKNATRS
jgi:hypothetical protein